MGNYCEQMCIEKGDFKFNSPGNYNAQYPRPSLVPYQYGATSALRYPDEPHPLFAQQVAMEPQLGGVVAEIMSHQNTIKPFRQDNMVGVDLPPYELIGKGVVYLGQWKDGAPHGFGRVFYNKGGYFQGSFDCGMAMCSDGIFIYPDGTFYRGQIKDSSANGTGILVYRSGEMVYNGTWLDDKPHGHGKQEYKDGSNYTGNFIAGVKEGTGRFRWANGSQYAGQFKDGYMHGEGVLKQSNGNKYSGTFFRNKKQGKGILEGVTGTYKGNFVDNKKMGEGEFTFVDGRVFKGAFYNDLPEGCGKMRMNNGEILTGVWFKGENVQINNGLEEGMMQSTAPYRQDLRQSQVKLPTPVYESTYLQKQLRSTPPTEFSSAINQLPRIPQISEREDPIHTSAVSIYTNNPSQMTAKIQNMKASYPYQNHVMLRKLSSGMDNRSSRS